MIFGDYPCCGALLSIPLAENCPTFQKENCPHCGAVIWHLHSRIEPKSWTEADFLKEYLIDEKSKSIKPINEPIPPTPEQLAAIERTTAELERRILYGTGTAMPLMGLIRSATKRRK